MDLDQPEINTSELTAEVRKSMERQVLKSHARTANAAPLDNTSQPASTPRLAEDNSTQATPMSTELNFASLNSQLSGLPKSPRLELQPVFEPNGNDEYHVNELLKFHDAAFLNAAYRAILKREPDSFSYNYLEQLRAGDIDRVDLLAILRFSSEGKLKNVRVKGLALPTFMRQLGHLPVIGYPIRLGIDLLRLPVLIHRTRQHEAYSLAQNRRLAEQANEVAEHVDTVSAYLSNLSAATTDLVTKTELHDDQHAQVQQQHAQVQQQLAQVQQQHAQVQQQLAQVQQQHAQVQQQHAQVQQQLDTLVEQQQQIVAELRQELKTQIDNERAGAEEQRQRLIQEQQSLLESSTNDTRNRIAQLESSARAWIAHIDSSVRAEIASVGASVRAEIASVDAATNDIRTKIAEAESVAGDLRTRIGTVESSSNDLRSTTSTLEASTNSVQAEIEKVYQQLQHARTELALQGRRMALILEEARTRLPAPFDQQQLAIIAAEEQHNLDALYAELEDNFRGSYDEIKGRFRTYLPHIKSLVITNDQPIVDLGCGRGEWLELLKEEGYEALGVDTNRVLLDRCRARGLDVVETDVLQYLRGLPDNNVAAITGFHIIEHLEIGVLMQLLDEVVRVVHPGGVVIFETPNPENVLVGSNYFYFDPTHRNPLPSLLMRFLLESRGLHRVEVMNLHAWDQARLGGKNALTARFNELFYGPMDYAIAGWKVSA